MDGRLFWAAIAAGLVLALLIFDLCLAQARRISRATPDMPAAYWVRHGEERT